MEERAETPTYSVDVQSIDIPPVHDLSFGAVPATGMVHDSVVFAPDGGLYAEVSAGMVNAWPVLVWYWPEVLGGLLCLCVLILLTLVVRTWRRPRVVARDALPTMQLQPVGNRT